MIVFNTLPIPFDIRRIRSFSLSPYQLGQHGSSSLSKLGSSIRRNNLNQETSTLFVPATLTPSRLTINLDSSIRLLCSTHSTTQAIPTTKGFGSRSNLFIFKIGLPGKSIARRTDNELRYSLIHFYKQCESMFDRHELRSDKINPKLEPELNIF